MFAATQFEYRHRYILHGLIYTLGFAAPWDYGSGNSGFHPGATWIALAGQLGRGSGIGVLEATNIVLVLAILAAFAGAALRLWGGAYLGTSVVQNGDMVGNRMIADGPYRYLRNPLYLGTIFSTLAIITLMKPAGAVLTLVLITLLQIRLIESEEPFLTRTLGPAYTEYKRIVPRLIPRLRSNVPHGGVRPQWTQAVTGEIFQVGTAISFAALGWHYDAMPIIQGMLVSLGLALVVRAVLVRR